MSFPERLARAARYVGEFWMVPPWMSTWKFPFLGPRAGAWVAATLALSALAVAARYGGSRRSTIWSAWLLVGTALTGAAYGWAFVDLQVWYRMQPALLLFVVVWVWIARVGTIGSATRWGRIVWSGALGLLVLYSGFKAYAFYRHPPIPYPWQADVYTSQREFDQRVPAGEVIGSFNAGIAGFFSPRRIVNLDGLVNASVVPYYRERRLERYFLDEGIHYIADEELGLRRAMAFTSRPIALRAVARAPLHGWPTEYRWLWTIAGIDER